MDVLEDEGERFGGVLRMWEGGILDCFDDRRIAIQTLCCPCYRFGKNMNRAGLGSSFLQGAAYLMFILLAAFNFVTFVVTRRHCFLYIALALTLFLGAYSGFLRRRMRNKFNIMGKDSYLDDCVYHLTCPCCSISQEARTLEMNNVEDGAWRGRGDTICVGNFSPPKLQPPPSIFVISSDPL
ncbi:hypothetical protein V2J09_019602 [Rumex salicifolius]